MSDDPVTSAIAARGRMEGSIRERALRDPDFHAALLADPKAALEAKLGASLGNAGVRVVEESPDEIVVVLPSAPAAAGASERELATLAGGTYPYTSGVATCPWEGREGC